jgi:hypothetical protein
MENKITCQLQHRMGAVVFLTALVLLSSSALATTPVVDLNGAAAGYDYAATFTEDAGAVPTEEATMATVTDNTDNIAAMVVTITNLLNGTSEVLTANTAGTSISASYNPITGVLTLSGLDTPAHYQQVLRTIAYNNTSNNPTVSPSRTITFVATDVGALTSATRTCDMSILAVNDAPSIDVNGSATGRNYSTSFTEDGGTIAIEAPDATVSDMDNVNLTSMTVTITNLLDAGYETLAANAGATGITASYNSTTGVLTLSGSSSVANYQTVLRTITYNNTDLNPTTTSRAINFVANDGQGNSTTATTTVSILAVNDPPAIDLNGATAGYNYSATFTEDGGAIAIEAADATVSDMDNVNLVSMTVTITNLLDAGFETLAANAGATGITVSYNSVTGVLTLSGSSSVANYQTVLRTITYNNTDQNPTTTSRAISFVANDGLGSSTTRTCTVNIVAVNDPPLIDLNGVTAGYNYSATFTEGGGAIAIEAADATVSDMDNVNLVSMTVTITNLLDAGFETLAASAGATGITVSYNSVTGVLTLSGSSSVANYQTVLRTITYNNTDLNPTTTSRAITFVANDGQGNSTTVTTTVSIVAVNDPPLIDLNGATAGYNYSATFTEDAGGVLTEEVTATVTSAVNIQAMVVTITNLLNGTSEVLTANTAGTSISASYNSITGVLTLSGLDTPAHYQQVLRTIAYNNTSNNPTVGPSRAITFVATDVGALTSATRTCTMSIVAVNDAPAIDLNGATAGYNYSTTFTEGGGTIAIEAADATVSDMDNVNLVSMTVTITNLLDAGYETLAANAGSTGITASYNSTTGVLTLSGSSSVASYQMVLRTITYNNTNQNPTTTSRVINFVANDGQGNSTTATATVSMILTKISGHETAGKVAHKAIKVTYGKDGSVIIELSGLSMNDPIVIWDIQGKKVHEINAGQNRSATIVLKTYGGTIHVRPGVYVITHGGCKARFIKAN